MVDDETAVQAGPKQEGLQPAHPHREVPAADHQVRTFHRV